MLPVAEGLHHQDAHNSRNHVAHNTGHKTPASALRAGKTIQLKVGQPVNMSPQTLSGKDDFMSPKATVSSAKYIYIIGAHNQTWLH
jgi:hypothetical protein